MQSLKLLQNKTTLAFIVLAFATIFLNFLIWLPHMLALENLYSLNFANGFATIYRNFDGVNYIVIAKTFYKPELIANLPQSLPANYYAAHFPGFSLAMLITAPFIGFLKSMLLISLIFTILSSWIFYLLVKDFHFSTQPLFLSLLFLVFPARWLIVHSVGSAEPMFIFFTLSSIYFFLKFENQPSFYNILYCALCGAIAQITRPPGILLFISFALYLIWKIAKSSHPIHNLFTTIQKYFLLLIIPLTLIAIFYWYSLVYGNFWAYFNSGDNIHLKNFFSVFNQKEYWVGQIWLEDVVYIFLFAFLATIYLLKNSTTQAIGFFVLTYTLATSLVAHRDISRYLLPIFPFCLIAFQKLLVSKEFKIAILIILLAIYLYSQNFILANTAPIPNLHYFN